jgi:hypothetical protein
LLRLVAVARRFSGIASGLANAFSSLRQCSEIIDRVKPVIQRLHWLSTVARNPAGTAAVAANNSTRVVSAIQSNASVRPASLAAM